MCEQVLAKADALEALDASISTLKYLREKEEDINPSNRSCCCV